MTDNTDRLGVLVLVAVVLLVLLPVFGMGMGMMGGGHMWDGGLFGPATPGWMLLVGIVMQLLFLVVLVGGAVVLYRILTGESGDTDEALEALRLAYARGELTEEEYDQRRERLERES